MYSKQNRRFKSRWLQDDYRDKWIEHVDKAYISWEWKSRFDGRNYNSDEWWNNDKCWCECEKRNVWEKHYVWNLSTCNCENGKYLETIMDEVFRSNYLWWSYRFITTKKQILMKKIATCKTGNFYILLAFL